MVVAERSRRLTLTLALFAAQFVLVVGLPLTARVVVPGYGFPGGAAAAQLVLGVLIGVVGSVIHARAVSALFCEQPPRYLVRLPRWIGRAVYLGHDLVGFGQDPRDRAWFSQRRHLCALAAGVCVWTWGLVLITWAEDSGVGEVARTVAVTGALLLAQLAPLAIYGQLLRRRWVPGDRTPGAARPAGHRDGAAGAAR